MKILLTIIIATIIIFLAVFLLNAASFDGVSKNKDLKLNENDKE